MIWLSLAVYYAAVNLLAAAMTIADKRRAKREKWRISEKALLLIGFLGGAPLELLMMKRIRHKTKHKRFMLGLPIAVLLHIALLVWLYIKTAQVI